jgi:hypothetical protein
MRTDYEKDAQEMMELAMTLLGQKTKDGVDRANVCALLAVANAVLAAKQWFPLPA